MSFIYLLRHGQSEANADTSLYMTKFNKDMEITEKGKQQATEAGHKLNDDKIKNKRETLGVEVFSSPYLRTIQTAEIISRVSFDSKKIRTDPLLSERCFGEQEGSSDVDNFNVRPMERHTYEKVGHVDYKAVRGESFMDVYVRATLFTLQHQNFQFIPLAVIVSHQDFCHTLHGHFTGEMPTPESSWKNCEIRKYMRSETGYHYLGKLK